MESLNNNINNNKFDFIFYGNNSSPNVYKIKLMFEELKSIGVTHDFRLIDLVKKENYSDEFIKINPNKKIPALVDNTFDEPFYIYESGSILIYLAQKYNKFLPDFKINPRENSNVITWTVWQVSNLNISNFNPTQELSPSSATNEKERLNKVENILNSLNERLSVNQYIGGKEYSIADIATAGVLLYLNHIPLYGCTKQTHSNIFKWLDLINQRESIQFISKQIKESLKDQSTYRQN